MDDDPLGGMSFLRAHVTEITQASWKLTDRALGRARSFPDRSARAADRSAAHLDDLVAELPGRYGLSDPPAARRGHGQVEFLQLVVPPSIRSACRCPGRDASRVGHLPTGTFLAVASGHVSHHLPREAGAGRPDIMSSAATSRR